MGSKYEIQGGEGFLTETIWRGEYFILAVFQLLKIKYFKLNNPKHHWVQLICR
jgi:hypothetical protein